MILTPTSLAGCYVIEPQRQEDERGFFSRVYCAEEFALAGLDPRIAQTSVSYNRATGTLRGLHYQRAPHSEAKLVRCTRGRVFDVAVDLRPQSDSYGQWTAVELTDDNGLAMYLPEGFAHGFLTLEPRCELLYQISVPFVPAAFEGIRWDDPSLAIRWPSVEHLTISARDEGLPTLR